MTEESRFRLDLVIKALGPMLVLAGLVFGIFKFQTTARLDRESREDQNKQLIAEAQREAKKPFYEQQLTLYLEATNVTARIAAPRDEQDKQAAIVRFWQLYWGPLALVESEQVAQAMIDFRTILEDTALSEEQRKVKLRNQTISLAKQCRNSLQESWDVELADILK